MIEQNPGYQMPLFDRYDLVIEFERRIGFVRPVPGANSTPAPERSLAEMAESVCEICPLRLRPDELELHLGYSWVWGRGPTAAESGRMPRHHWSGTVPYAGDDELWHLYPRPLENHPSGEIFRGHLILISLAPSEVAAEHEMRERLAVIEEILALQQQRIREFEHFLPGWVARAITRPNMGKM